MNADDESPYMLMVANVRDGLRNELSEEQKEDLLDEDLCRRAAVPLTTLPAITHVDYSARVQTVDSVRNPIFHGLIKKFHAMTGCPVLINTSFNVRGEPIVCKPEDAYHCFMGTNMDVLVLGRAILKKADQPNANETQREEYLAQFKLD